MPNRPSGSLAAPLQRQVAAPEQAAADVGVGAYSEEKTFLQHAIGAYEVNKLEAGAALFTSRGIQAVALSDSAFAVGPFTTDMGNYFYVYRFTKTNRAKSTYGFSRGMSEVGWDTEQLRKGLGLVQGTHKISITAQGLVSSTPAGGKGQVKPGGGGGAQTGGTQTGVTATEESGSVPVPEHRRLWIQAGRAAMGREVMSKLDSLQELKDKRIAAWAQNARIKDPKPVREALEIALSVVGAGIGGVIGKVLAEKIASALIQEFVKSAGKKAAEVGFDKAAKAAISRTEQVFTRRALDKAAKNAQIALASKGDLISCFVEAQTLMNTDDEAEQVTQFNLREKSLSDEELADEVQCVTMLYEALFNDPTTFMREMTMGLMRLKDEIYIEKKAGEYGGDRQKMFEKDAEIDSTDIRSGNLLLRPVGAAALAIGEYYNPRLNEVTGFGALATEVGNATLADLKGTKLQDLPFSLTFRFWAPNPFKGLLQDPLCKVWFVRRNDGTIVVDPNDADDENGLEWLASYYLGTSKELTKAQQRANMASGARKLYEAVKDRPLVAASNFDIL